jgi:hypothetical protein
MFVMKFLDGTPVPADYLRAVERLVREAADGDPGEEGEAEVLKGVNDANA